MDRRAVFPLLAALTVTADGWLKRYALAHFPPDTSVQDPGLLALVVHKNFGIAFNIPMRGWVILVISIALGLALGRLAWTARASNPAAALAALTVIIGGIGNVIDRAWYGFTVDYLLLFGRSAFNLSDVVIIGGIVWLLSAGQDAARTEESIDKPPQKT